MIAPQDGPFPFLRYLLSGRYVDVDKLRDLAWLYPTPRPTSAPDGGARPTGPPARPASRVRYHRTMKSRLRAGLPVRKTLAQKVLAELKHAPRPVLEALRRAVRDRVAHTVHQAGTGYDDPVDAGDFGEAMRAPSAMQTVLGALDGLGPIRSIAAEIAALEEELMPGGPPMSPVHDSMFASWTYTDMRFGRTQETVVQLTQGLASLLELDASTRDSLERYAAGRLGLYRVVDLQPARVGRSARFVLRELVTERTLVTQMLEDYQFRPPQLVLVRPLELPESSARKRDASHLVIDSPYELIGTTDPDWFDYLEREAAELKCRLDRGVYEQLMRGVGNPRRWIDFVVDGYVGTRERNRVVVEGIPDRPETLPHHLDHEPEQQFVIPPGATSKERSQILTARISRALHESSTVPNGPRSALAGFLEEIRRRGGDAELWLGTAAALHLYLGGSKGEAAWIEGLVDRGGFDDDALEYARCAKGAIVSAFEVLEVDPGRTVTVRDLFGPAIYCVSERSASMSLTPRVLVLGMVTSYREIAVFEAMCPLTLPPLARDALVERVREQLGPRASPHDVKWFYSLALLWQEETARRAPASTRRPTLMTTTGELVEPTEATYTFSPPQHSAILDALARLRGCVLRPSDGADPETMTFEIVTRGIVEGTVLVGPASLTVQANARLRASKIEKRIISKIPGVLTLRSRSTETVESLLAARAPRAIEAPPPEAHALMAQFMAERYRTSFLQEPIPALQGLSPREAAKDPAMHGALDALLREHEASVARQVGPDAVDFEALRRTLGLRR